MSETLEFTGERFTPECEREIWYEHVHRYAFAASLVKGLRVLDAACGEGYGSALLADTAAAVTGVDLATDAVEHARRRYGDRPNLGFQPGDCAALPFAEAAFDCVVSFETIEHVTAQEAVLAEFRRVLKPGGFLLVSSPDKAVYTEAHGTDNPFHVRELYRHEFEALLATQFPAVRMLGQKLLFHSAIWSFADLERVHRQVLAGGSLDSPPRMEREAMYLLALCAASEGSLPRLDAGLWLFDDAQESVYRHYHGEIRRNMAAGGIISARDREIEALRARVAELEARRPSWLARLLRR